MDANEVIQTAHHQQQTVITRLQKAVASQQLAHAFLFAGPNGQGQAAVASWLAMRLMCENPMANGDPDGTCSQCQRISQHEHPDVIEVHPDGLSIKIDQIRYLQDEFTKTAVEGAQKIFIIYEADKMTDNAANGLLKFIEEPHGQQTAILMVENPKQLLPTIVSRTQVIEFHQMQPKAYQQQLLNQGFTEYETPLVMALTDSLSMAKTWLEDDWFKLSQEAVVKLVTQILILDPEAFNSVQMEFMPLAKERERQGVLIAMLAAAWRDVVMMKIQADTNLRFVDNTAWQTALAKYSVEQLLAAQDIILTLPVLLQQNIGFQTTVETGVLKCQFALGGTH
ncbi:DNA polymerase III subunit delta' [Weissella kandleri]|uniref:DNA polymerase III subunit delta' n=1 Tax=Weissella kandleri TaxID=1616 RepID=UPI00387EA176